MTHISGQCRFVCYAPINVKPEGNKGERGFDFGGKSLVKFGTETWIKHLNLVLSVSKVSQISQSNSAAGKRGQN